MRVLRHLLSGGLAVVLIGLFLHVTVHPWPNPPMGQVQLLDPPGQNVVFQTLSEKSRYPIFEPTGRVFSAMVQLFAALMLILPWTRKFGAFLAFMVLAAAVCLHLSPWLGQELPLSMAAGETRTDNGGRFSLAISMLVMSVLILVVHPARQR